MSDPTNLAMLLGGMAVLAIPSVACAVNARKETKIKRKNKLSAFAGILAFPPFVALGFVLDGFAGSEEPLTIFVGIIGALLMFAIAKGKVVNKAVEAESENDGKT